MARPKNYLNNKDILKEIHRSKTTYCAYAAPEDEDFDIILGELSELTPELVESTKQVRAERLAKLAQDEQTALNIKTKLAEFYIDPASICASDIVFRVTNWDHILVDDVKQQKANAKAQLNFIKNCGAPYDFDPSTVIGKTQYVKVNFPPFFHYRVDENNAPYVVAKSHWKGSLENGDFNKVDGNMTPTLANMFVKLCDRYATRSNWCRYTYNDEMRGQALLQLAQIGLQFNEAKSQNPFAYYTSAITNSFTRVLNIEKRNQNIRDDILEMNDLSPSFTRQLQHENASKNRNNPEGDQYIINIRQFQKEAEEARKVAEAEKAAAEGKDADA